MTFRQFAFRNVIRNRRIYATFFISSVASVMVFFIYSMLMFHPRVEDEFLREIAFQGMFVAEVILVLFTLFFLFYSMRAFLEARSKEFGILLHLGMEKRQLNKLILFETMITGFAAIVVGIIFGYAFSKFFFMIVREILQIDSLPLYFSWKPFALTIVTFTSLYIIISFVSVMFIKDDNLVSLLRGYWHNEQIAKYSVWKGIAGLLLLAAAYGMAANINKEYLVVFVTLIPPFAMIGTYLFFTDSVPFILFQIRKHRKWYWHKYRIVSMAKISSVMRENSRMFFISCMVSTLAFLAIGILSSMSTFTHQYHQLNPLGLVYSSKLDNPYEKDHISGLIDELEDKGLSYHLYKFDVKRQTSSNTQKTVKILTQTDINRLALVFGYPVVSLKAGEAMFLPYSMDSIDELKRKKVTTVLQENSIPLSINKVYPKVLFSPTELGTNVIVVSDEDFRLIKEPMVGANAKQSTNHIFVFSVPEWTKTKDIGQNLDALMTEAYMTNHENDLPFYFENPGLDYSFIRSTFALLLFIGLLAAAVFFLASGSFIYFKLYAGLEEDKKQFDALRRMGITDKELRKIVNSQLIPQFFLPWGLAMLHSTFAFMALQVFWKGIADLSIIREIFLVLAAITCMQLCYFYLIRWRYLAHIRAI
ncbi:FtsX-like permease family protein [Rummeliibacillus suwonensis]|uniref:FtsX-like permease family protein n=1 Tax=Rummeliibacillus suwonensis TaxID=1306154 RepID=UPI0011B7B242|nr:ABC transporter permease [Rummeliibacillus suwonensis]MBO2535139.1 ABC transporter permease [Rummeliibacillus suwonensis]